MKDLKEILELKNFEIDERDSSLNTQLRLVKLFGKKKSLLVVEIIVKELWVQEIITKEQSGIENWALNLSYWLKIYSEIEKMK